MSTVEVGHHVRCTPAALLLCGLIVWFPLVGCGSAPSHPSASPSASSPAATSSPAARTSPEGYVYSDSPSVQP
jgi:hypothetical protein